MKEYSSLVMGLLISAAFAAQSYAEPVIVSATRSLSVAATQFDGDVLTSSDFGSFQDDLLISGYVRQDGIIAGSVSASGSQTSTVSTILVRGMGRGSGYGSGLAGEANGIGSSRMRVEFDITKEPLEVYLLGQLRLTPHGLGLNGSSAFVRVSGPDGIVPLEVDLSESSLPPDGGIVDFSGASRLQALLEPGSYVLEALAEGIGSGARTRCADFDFTLSFVAPAAIPEPSAGALLLGGLMGAWAGRGRQRR